MLLTISGLPGSGTSTVASRVAAALGIDHLDGGTVFRALARERGLSVAEFSALAETDETIDLALDARLAARAHDGDVVLESRLAGWIAMNEGLASIRVWIECDDEERARRVAEREALELTAALAANRLREASERERYVQYYGIDLDDRSIYDLVLDSTETDPAELTALILAAAGAS